MRKIMRIWEDLQTIGCPDLRDDVELDGWLFFLDLYMTSNIEEFIECEGVLAPSSIVQLRNSKRELASLLKQLDGWRHSYFEQLLLLSREVLRRVRVKEAYLIVAREAEREMEAFCSGSLFSDFLPDVVTVADSPMLSTEQSYGQEEGQTC